MKRIEYRDSLTNTIRVAATNSEGEGFFIRGETDSAYHQTQGTGQFRVRSRDEFVHELQRRGMVLPDESNIVAEYGWE